MPIHDWTRVGPSIYHDFHSKWVGRIGEALDARLPKDYYAIDEWAAGGYVADVPALRRGAPGRGRPGGRRWPGGRRRGPGLDSAEARSRRVPRKNSVVAVKRAGDDRAVAPIELVSPGNKSSKEAFRELVGKSVDLLRRGVHLLLVDPLPPGPRDPGGAHPPIWRRLGGKPVALPADRPLTFASYESKPPDTRASIERLAGRRRRRARHAGVPRTRRVRDGALARNLRGRVRRRTTAPARGDRPDRRLVRCSVGADCGFGLQWP